MKVDTAIAPARWASLLVDNDGGSLAPNDRMSARLWEEGLLPARIVSADGEEYWSRYWGTEVVQYTTHEQ